jgi:hypothetical protein
MSCSYAQEDINMIEILNMKKDMRHLEKRISKLIRQNPDIAKMKGLKQFHILYLGIDDATKLTKEDYINQSFLYHLYTGHTDNKSFGFSSFDVRVKCIRTNTLLTDSEGTLVTHGDAIYFLPVSSSYVSIDDTILAKMFFNKEIDFAFRIVSPFEMRFVEIGIKGNNLYVFGIDDDGYEIIYTWEEFIECCLEDWINGRRTKKWTG